MATHLAGSSSQFQYLTIKVRPVIESVHLKVLGKMIASKEDDIREALRMVIDPEIGLNVVELGLIRELEVANSDTKITMILTTPFCPYGPAMIEQVRSTAAQAADGAVVVELGTEMWDPSMMEEGTGGDWGLF
jgi:metal-sulfur cluster biosynthetic enzyme